MGRARPATSAGNSSSGKSTAASSMAEARMSAIAPASLHLREPPAELGQGLTPLALGLGVDEIGDALGLGQVELAVFKGAARELTRLGQPQALGGQSFEHQRRSPPPGRRGRGIPPLSSPV